ncbi:MAG: 50S ribosomal protein L11 methyltransferase [Candidatus Omnitrophica bacterium]|nr:50S ribosomal protein L11 methyltransferase [Candidatus Omnitrophota bacterium]
MNVKLNSNKVWQFSCCLANRDSLTGELLYGVLLQAGIKPEEIVEIKQKKQHKIIVYFSLKNFAQKLVTRIAKLNLRGVVMSLKILRKSDWQDRWKKGIKPFALTKRIDIVPRWAAKQYRKTKKIPIYIDTNLAFGTGLHETTRFMAQLIEKSRANFQSFLDVGTGSGILSIVAHISGAESIVAMDIDRQSIGVAKSNFAANNVMNIKIFCADLQKWKKQAKYDIVAANLVSNDLIAFGNKLVAVVKSQKYLAVSGISLKNLALVRKSFAKLALSEVKILRGKMWAAILYQRKS